MILNHLKQGQVYIGTNRISEIYIGNTKVFPCNEDLVFLDWVRFTDSVWYYDEDTVTLEGQEPYLNNTNLFIRPDIRPKTLNIHVTMTVDFHTPNPLCATFFGNRTKYNAGEYRVGIGGSDGRNVNCIDFNSYCTDKSSFNGRYGSSGYRYDNSNPYYNKHEFHNLETIGNKLYIDGNLHVTCGKSGYWERVRPWCPFGGCRTIKETSMWVEGNLMYHYVPAKKGKYYGLYDIESAHFFGKETYIGGYDDNIIWG